MREAELGEEGCGVEGLRAEESGGEGEGFGYGEEREGGVMLGDVGGEFAEEGGVEGGGVEEEE